MEKERRIEAHKGEMGETGGVLGSEDHAKDSVCVLDASTYVGFWTVKKLLLRGYTVHAAFQSNGGEIISKKIMDFAQTEERLLTFTVDVLDYHSILEALKGCCALFCCLDNPDGYNDKNVDWEVRGAINVVEACAQTTTIEKIVFSSSLTAAIWRESICSQKDVDESTWSDQEFCTKKKLWHALAKTLSEKAAWALAMDRMLNMVSINGGLVLGPAVVQQNPAVTMAYLQGAEQMYENGVLAVVDVDFLADVHLRAFEDKSTTGRYLCFDQIVNTEEEAVKLAQSLSPLISLPPRYKFQDSEAEAYAEKLRSKKLSKLVEGTAAF